MRELVTQRLCATSFGYEVLDDHGELRGDARSLLLVGKREVTGAKQIR